MAARAREDAKYIVLEANTRLAFSEMQGQRSF